MTPAHLAIDSFVVYTYTHTVTHTVTHTYSLFTTFFVTVMSLFSTELVN